MLKPVEREWWHQVGRPVFIGALSVIVPSVITWGLMIGLTVN